MRIFVSAAALLPAAFLIATLFSAPAMAADGDAADRVTVVTDARGRPPFRRARVSAEAEFSRFEETDGVAVRRARHTGRPPFNRHAGDDDAASAAEFSRFEEASEQRTRRRGPPGKMTSRR